MGYILNGVYHDGERKQESIQSNSATYKQYSHDQQRQDHAKDLIQPYVNGKPNEAFIEQYPEESKTYGFIPKED